MSRSRPFSHSLIEGLLRRHSHRPLHRSTAPAIRHPFPPSSPPSSSLFTASFSARPTSSNASFKHHSPLLSLLRSSPTTPKHKYTPFRSFSFNSPKLNSDFASKLFHKPAAALTSAFSRYSEAIGLQIEAFFKRNHLFLWGAGGVVLCGLLWKIMFGLASAFVGLSEGMAKYGFLALSSAIVAFAGLYIRSRFTINPDKVYRMAMTRLNTSAKILEVMGAPLSGTDIRAYVMSGGGLTLKKFKPSIRSRRCFLIFPIRGSERKGLVSVEVKKKKGQYDIKLLAIDVPMASGPDQRWYLEGNEEEYKVGGGLISELRDPVVKAMAATKEFDDLDETEEEEDAERERQKAERERQEAERKHREEVEKLENSGT